MLPQLKAFCINNNCLKQTDFSLLGKLLFLSGYLDMTTGIFIMTLTLLSYFLKQSTKSYTTDKDAE